MCGIAGALDVARQASSEILHKNVAAMTRTLGHRGPDNEGIWTDAQWGIALGHRRLSIVDLSEVGHQPMRSASGRYIIVFNGEIYNFSELRHELESAPFSYRFNGSSDTEVMLAAFECLGIEPALSRFNGMFAFALWDRQQHLLYLGRDRLGEKPLYYGWSGKHFLFGSELKALIAHPAFASGIDRDALALYLRYGYVPEPFSIYQGIHKLPPGSFLTVDPTKKPPLLYLRPYWSAREVAEKGLAHPFQGTEEEITASLDQLLQRSIAQRMVADVPLGAFLSGGIDSSTVVALMQVQSPRPIKTFSIGFEDAGFNEAGYAAAVAKHLRTDHTELYVTSHQAQGIIPSLAHYYDEPFADSSQIPTFLVSQLARQHVTVSLSGDGGDELFGGYNRYVLGQQVWQKTQKYPSAVRQLVSKLLQHISPAQFDQLEMFLRPLFKDKVHYGTLGQKLSKLQRVLTMEKPDDFYRQVVSVWDHPQQVMLAGQERPIAIDDAALLPGNFTARMMLYDLISYLPGDILTKVDRASMANSLEARVPFLDHHVVEFAWQVPLSMKIRNGQGKWLLRQVLYQYLPKGLMERPKLGFGVPVGAWLRGPLRDWAEALLAESRLSQEGFFRSDMIRSIWKDHLTGKLDAGTKLWTILMFQSWLENQRVRPEPVDSFPDMSLSLSTN